MNEAALIFEKIHDEFRSKIQRYLTRIVGEFEAEDLTQEVFVKVNRALVAFKGESRISTWIYRIATNAALDKLRSPAFKRSGQKELPAETGETEIDEAETRGQDETPSPEERLFLRERYDCYCNFIEALPINYRAVVVLSELENLAVGEIADILGLSVEVVKIRLHRGRAKLLQELKAHCRSEDWL